MSQVFSIDAERVEAIFRDCLFDKSEDAASLVVADGITINAAFNADRLQGHKSEICEMLEELPIEFQQAGGGGMSFLNACNDRHGNQWTGLHQRMEQLFQLGIGVGKVDLLMPREVWPVLPGGMPYYVVK